MNSTGFYSIGETFNHLTIISLHHTRRTPNGTIRYYMNCVCDCGNKCIKGLNQIRNGHVKSCGCSRGENLRKLAYNNKTLATILTAMKQRCYNVNADNYSRYGGRGIKVCDEWLADSDSFIIWATVNGYKKGLQIDRIDTDGNYEPNNCRWVSNRVNSWNKRNNRKINYNGIEYCFSEFCYKFNIKNRPKAYYRFYNRGDSVEDLLIQRDNGDFTKEVI